jgi:hypothetical protein
MENNTTQLQENTFKTSPSYIGGWYLGGKIGFGIMLSKKPNLIHIFFMKLLLGVEWLDKK